MSLLTLEYKQPSLKVTILYSKIWYSHNFEVVSLTSLCLAPSWPALSLFGNWSQRLQIEQLVNKIIKVSCVEVKGMGCNIRKLVLKSAIPFPMKPTLTVARQSVSARHSQRLHIGSFQVFLLFFSYQWLQWKSYNHEENISIMQMDREDHGTPLDL